MKLYTLERQIEVEAPLAAAFPFFENPANLKLLTPPQLGMRMLTPEPITMQHGAVFDYVVAVAGLDTRWTSYIADYDPPHRFVDVQLRGPYAYWHHTHTFEARGDKTLIRDEVRYMLPFGPLGSLAHALFVRRQLESIFSFRARYLQSKRDWDMDPGIPA